MFEKINIYAKLPQNTYVLFLVQFINKLGEFVNPFLTLYLTTKLKLSLVNTGLIITICCLISIPGSLIGGYFSDNIGRKITYLVGQTTAAMVLIPCGLIKNPYLIIVLILISRFFNGVVRPPIAAMIIDTLPPNKRKLGFSLQYLGGNLGTAIGPIIAGVLFNKFLPALFIGDAITSFIAVFLVLIFIKETIQNKIEQVSDSQIVKKQENIIVNLLRNPSIIVFLIILTIYNCVYAQYTFSLPLTLNKVYLTNGVKIYSILMSVNSFIVLIFTIFITKVTEKLHSLCNIILVGILYAIGFGMIGIIHSFVFFIISTILWSIGEILLSTNSPVYLANNSPKNFRARFNSLSTFSWSIGTILGTSIMSKYIDLMGINSVWFLTFLLSLISTILTAVLYFSVKKHNLDKDISM